MIQEFFSDVTEISGVEAVVLLNNKNQIMDSWTVPKYNPTIFTEVGEAFLHILGLIEYLKYDMNEISVPFDRGIVFALSRQRFYLVVLSRVSVEISMIRLAASVAVREFEESKKGKKILKKLPEQKFYQIKSITLDDVEKIMLENILEDVDGR